MKPYPKLLLLALFLVIASKADAQMEQTNKDSINGIRTAENLTSGNTQQVLTRFFQLAFGDLTGKDKEFRFTSSIFALKLKTNPGLNVSQEFVRHSFARRTNVSWALKLDSAFHFNGFAVGAKYAFVNLRDYNTSRKFTSQMDAAMTPYNNVDQLIGMGISNLSEDSIILLTGQYAALKDLTKPYDSAGPTLRRIIQSALGQYYGAHPITPSEYFGMPRKIYDSVIATYTSKPLIVAGVDLKTFRDQVTFSKVDLYLDGTGGIAHFNRRRVDLDLVGTALLTFRHDSTTLGRDLNRSFAHAEAGLNLAFRNQKLVSTMELKATAGYDQIFTGRHTDEKEQLFTLNGTVRVRITDDINIPLTFRYDPQQGNVLGVLNVVSNFDWLNRILGAKSS